MPFRAQALIQKELPRQETGNLSSAPLLSHQLGKIDIDQVIKQAKQRITEAGDKPYVTVQEQHTLIDQLAAFELGRFLLAQGGINAKWTRYISFYPQRGRVTGLNSEGVPFSPLEKWLLDKAPIMKAVQQRFENYQKVVADHMKPGMVVASVPCGLMDGLLSLDTEKITGVQLVGIDLDPNALAAAQQEVSFIPLTPKPAFIQANAWQLDYPNTFDIVLCSGLSMYEPNDQRVIELYKEFHKVLKTGGLLITNFLTPPLKLCPNSLWALGTIDPEDLRLQQIIFNDIIQAKWQVYRTEKQTANLLHEAGFVDIQFIYDQHKMSPTATSRKIS